MEATVWKNGFPYLVISVKVRAWHSFRSNHVSSSTASINGATRLRRNPWDSCQICFNGGQRKLFLIFTKETLPNPQDTSINSLIMLDFTKLDDSNWNAILEKMTDPVFEGPYTNGPGFPNLDGVNYVDNTFAQPAAFATTDFAAEPTTTNPAYLPDRGSNDRDVIFSLAEISQMKQEVESQKKRFAKVLMAVVTVN